MTNPTDEEFGKAKAGENTQARDEGTQQNSPPSPTPAPPDQLPSRGWRLVRVPTGLHAKLLEQSRARKISIHALISGLLAQ